MGFDERQIGSARQRVVLALWAVPGVGPKTLQQLEQRVDLAQLLTVPVGEWVGGAGLPGPVARRLLMAQSLDGLADRVMARLVAGDIGVAFPGSAEYPELMRDAPDAPPLLFFRGRVGPPRRRLAMVGSRRPDGGFLPYARGFARTVAEAGVGVVSGAAEGVDRACHWGALDAGGETWAFLGSALDELDPAQAKLQPHFLERGGVFFSELPPGVRASTTTFPRRNRLISGASDAVLILRAGDQSGSLHTALAAIQQGRPLLALPGEPWNAAAVITNGLVRAGKAQLALSAEDALRAVGVRRGTGLGGAALAKVETLSEQAQAAYAALAKRPSPFDEVLAACALPAAALTSALCELELSGLVVQYPGKLYERI